MHFVINNIINMCIALYLLH